MNIDIHQLAVSLNARVFTQLACCLPASETLVVVWLTDFIMHNQDANCTAIDWIIASRRYLQLQLPERCASHEDPQAKPVTYIATAHERGLWLEVQVLASNATYPQTVGRYKTVEECQEAVKPFGQVTWVTPYRFQKEATAY